MEVWCAASSPERVGTYLPQFASFPQEQGATDTITLDRVFKNPPVTGETALQR